MNVTNDEFGYAEEILSEEADKAGNYDPIRFYSTEISLVSRPVFQEHPLCLCCHVPASLLADDWKYNSRDCGLTGNYFDYLIISKDLSVRLAVKLDKNRRRPAVTWDSRNFPVLSISPALFQRDPGVIEQHLVSLLSQPRPDSPKCPFQIVPKETWTRLYTTPNVLGCDNCSRAYVTEYGESLSCFIGYHMCRDGQVRYTLFCHRQAVDVLRETVAWGSSVSRSYQKTIPLSQRMGRAKQGLPCNDIYMMDLIQNFARMPLSVYLKDDPDGLKEFLNEFRRHFPGQSPTYQQAAVFVHHLQMDGLEGGRSDTVSLLYDPAKGNDLMKILAGPLISAYNRQPR